MHTCDEKVGKRAARRDRGGPENTTRGLNSVGESLRWCSNLMPSHEVGQLCNVCGSKSGVTHWASLIAISLLPPGGQSCVLSTGLQVGVFPRSAGVCSRRPHSRTEREREREREIDTAGGGAVATRLQRQSVIVEHCTTVGELIVIKCWSTHAVVRGFLETSTHKSHRYISRYPEVFEKKSRLIIRKIRYLFGNF